MGRTTQFCNSDQELRTKMHFRQLVLLVALCTLMCAVKATSVDSEATSGTDMAATSAAARYVWYGKMYKSGFKFRYYTRAYNTRTHRYQGGRYWKRTYYPKYCKKRYGYRTGKNKWYVYQCRMCRKTWRGRYACLGKKLRYTKRCYKRGFWWRTHCWVHKYRMGYYRQNRRWTEKHGPESEELMNGEPHYY